MARAQRVPGARAVIGTDVGGTHTDVTVIYGDRIRRGKALTTYDDFSRGILDATAVAAQEFGLTLGELLGQTSFLINGTTVVTNAITQLRGSRVGVVVTAGFKDTFRFAGGPRQKEFDDHLQVNVPDIVSRHAIAEIEERVDYTGTEILPLNVEQLEAEASRLVDEEKIEALAVCFLSSFLNPRHELEAEAQVRALYPDLFVTLSHRVFPVIGENRRWTTAVFNSFVQDRAQAYVDSLSTTLRGAGLQGGLAFFQGLGGGVSIDKAKEYPLALLGSGPSAGAIGANELARQMGHSRVLIGDMGGTSFDTGLITDNELTIEKNLDIGPFETGVNLVDIVSIGAGGGSIAWVGERGVPEVGPHSAGSDPGPAAYGRGGTEPTVTDAMVSLGFIDPNHYLAGRVKLHPEYSCEALERVLCKRFDWSLEEASSAVHDLIVVNMANSMREVSVGRGFDPRNFAFFAYGGTLPLFCMQIADRLGIETVIVPQNSSVFCALGLLAADFVARYDQTVAWELTTDHAAQRVNEVAERLVESGHAHMLGEGFSEQDVRVLRSADFRFQGQSHELTMPLPDRPLVPADAPALACDFVTLYERTYGRGTAWTDVPVVLLNYTVTVVGRQPDRTFNGRTATPASVDDALRTTRSVFLPGVGRREDIPVYDDRLFGPGGKAIGPAIVDAHDTTIYAPPGVQVSRDEYMNYVLTRTASNGSPNRSKTERRA